MSKIIKKVEASSTVGLLLIAVALVAPFSALDSGWVPVAGKWIYAAGAIIYTAARMVNVKDPDDSSRLRRLRRTETWAGFCFIIGSFFWFYNTHRVAGIVFSLPAMRDTIAFTLAGAIIQVIASWMISSQMAKEKKKVGKNND